MGDFFKKDKKQPDEEEEKLIDNFEECCVAYDSLDEKYNMMKEEATPLISPIIVRLCGEGRNEKGMMDKIREFMARNRFLERMKTGATIHRLLDDVDNLIGWTQNMEEYNEKFVADYQRLARSLMAQVETLDKNNEKLEAELEKLQGALEEAQARHEEDEPRRRQIDTSVPLTKEEEQKLWDQFCERYMDYVKSGGVVLRKGRIFILAQADPRKRALLDEWFQTHEVKRAQGAQAYIKHHEKPAKPVQTNKPSESAQKSEVPQNASD